jgi:hypothetical protein
VVSGNCISGRTIKQALQREQAGFIIQVGDALQQFELEGFEVQGSRCDLEGKRLRPELRIHVPARVPHLINVDHFTLHQIDHTIG